MPLKTHHNRSGFSLIEIMVAVTIFALVMMVSTSAVLTLIDANRKAQSIKSVMNNLNFAIESISRNIRVGTNYRCHNTITGTGSIDNPQDCPTSGNVVLTLEAQHGDASEPRDQLSYKFVPYDSSNPETTGALFRKIGPVGCSSGMCTGEVRLTAPEVIIEDMRFYVDGAALSDDGIQPRVRMVVKGYADVGGEKTEFSMQTTVTQRVLDI